MFIDLTREYIGEDHPFSCKEIKIPLSSANTAYTGIVYEFQSGSMQGTYIDFPGHIAECADGITAENFPVEELFRVPASLIRLNRNSGSGAVTAEDLQNAVKVKPQTKALIINALGEKNPQDIEKRSVYLSLCAVQWIIDCGCKILLSDIYESQALEGVFLQLFKAGISTICEPVNLWKIEKELVKLTVLFPMYPHLTQVPCRVIADWQ